MQSKAVIEAIHTAVKKVKKNYP